MARKTTRTILERQLDARHTLWPHVTDEMLWSWKTRKGFVPIPRVMPLIMNIMDDLSGKGFPVGGTYLEMWSRLYDELFLTLNRPEEMAFNAGFTGQRALRTWKDRVKRICELGFIESKTGPLGDISYIVFLNPYHVIKRHYYEGRVQEAKWQALVIRANEIGAYDLDDVDEKGVIIKEEEEDEEEEMSRPRRKPRRRRREKSSS